MARKAQTITTGITAAKRAKSPSQPTGQWIRSEKRLAINMRDGMRCVYCLADLHGADPRDITLDHIVAKVDGGSNAESNLVTACRSCNSARQNTSLARFAGPETRKDIKRLTARSLKPFLKLAKAYFADKVGMEETNSKTEG